MLNFDFTGLKPKLRAITLSIALIACEWLVAMGLFAKGFTSLHPLWLTVSISICFGVCWYFLTSLFIAYIQVLLMPYKEIITLIGAGIIGFLALAAILFGWYSLGVIFGGCPRFYWLVFGSFLLVFSFAVFALRHFYKWQKEIKGIA